jgi:signal transduction histidine kinase
VDGDRWVAEVAHDPEGSIVAGDEYPVSATNCERTAATEETLILGDVAADAPDLAERAGYTDWGVSCYLGAPVHVDDGVYGTLCFYHTEPRAAFDDWEVTFVDLMSRWVGEEIERDRRTERLKRQNERLDQFASFVSHDLRGPLSVVRGRLDLAEQTGDAEQFAAARDALDRMERLVEDLLALARASDLPEDPETVALDEAARRAWATVDADGPARLQVETDRTVVADAGPLEQLLVNLFANAVEHGAPDGKGVTVTVGETTTGFYVADDGTGIPADERDRVFDSGYSTDRDGTGYGLAIIDEVATAHGWSVSLEASDAGGLRVVVGVDGD